MLQEIKGLREELSTRLNSNNTLELIKEKEEQIKGLLEEGKAHFSEQTIGNRHLHQMFPSRQYVCILQL